MVALKMNCNELKYYGLCLKQTYCETFCNIQRLTEAEPELFYKLYILPIEKLNNNEPFGWSENA